MTAGWRWMIVLVAAGGLATASPEPLAAQQLEVTLPEAVRRALDVQPAVVQARGAVTNAGWQKRAAYGAFLPTVSLTSTASRQNDTTVGGIGVKIPPGIYTYNTGLTASVDLFTGFKRLASYRNADATEDAADAGLANQRYQVTAATQQLFFTALADEELVRVAQAQVQRAQEERQISVNKFQAGAATRSDTLTSTVDLGNAQLALLQAQANLATAQANLARQIGVDGTVRAVPDSQLPALPDTTGLRAAALQQAPAVTQATAQERAASASTWTSRSQFWPKLTATYNTSSQGLTQPWNGFDSPTQKNLNRFTIGLSWTLFDGFTREQAVAQSSVSLDVARAQTADTRRQLSAQLTQQLAATFTGHAQIGITGANVVAAAEALRVQQERYRLGAATLLDLLTAEANLTQAQVNQVQARYNYLISRAQVEALVGHAL
ncbi:MAG: hypothetical protein DMD65_05050 [Gemmatimonadetes bacterium]|nr:MAG: hypothetical protein DMD65_05050 [Gemmatimonadota bacterium]